MEAEKSHNKVPKKMDERWPGPICTPTGIPPSGTQQSVKILSLTTVLPSTIAYSARCFGCTWSIWGGVGRVTTMICVPTLCQCIQGSQAVPCAKTSQRPHCSFIINPSVLFRYSAPPPHQCCRANVLFPLLYIWTLHTLHIPCPSLITSNWQCCEGHGPGSNACRVWLSSNPTVHNASPKLSACQSAM